MSKDSRPQAERLAALKAYDLAAELVRSGEAPSRARFETELFGWRVVVEVRPANELPADLTPCERDIVALLRGRQGRMTMSEIIGELTRLAHAGKVELHGESTVRHALPRLVYREILTSRRRSPQGYSVADCFLAQPGTAEAG